VLLVSVPSIYYVHKMKQFETFFPLPYIPFLSSTLPFLSNCIHPSSFLFFFNLLIGSLLPHSTAFILCTWPLIQIPFYLGDDDPIVVQKDVL